jgi:hypothetical protein
MNATDKKIAETLAKFGEPMAGNVWRVQGTAVIYHKALERIAAHAKIRFDIPTIIRAERDEAVLMVVGHMSDRTEWSVGEAVIGVNYRVSGKQAAYVWAMAEKRAKDRVILKLIELSGDLYSEEEADDLKDARPLSTPSSESSQDNQQELEPVDESKTTYIKTCRDKIAQPSITEAELRNWWRNESAARRAFDLEQTEVDGLKEKLVARLEQLKVAA